MIAVKLSARHALLAALLGVAAYGSVAHADKVRSIRGRDLDQALSTISSRTLRQGQKALTRAAFAAKLDGALTSPEHLKRTFPSLLGTMVAHLVGSDRLPGRVVPIAFDAHIENAGKVRLGKDGSGRARTISAHLDLDDSGRGPAGVDAISIGTALVQAGFSRKVVRRASAAFARAATAEDVGAEEARGAKWGKRRREYLARHTEVVRRDGAKTIQFRGAKKLRVGAKDFRTIARAAATDSVLRDYQILDVITHEAAGGGSGGIVELEMLARGPNGKPAVFVLKQQLEPGAAALGIAQPNDGQRIPEIERGLWGEARNNVFFYLRGVGLSGAAPMDFLVRDQLAIAGEVATGKHADETAVRVARLYGRAHAGHFGSLPERALARWMNASSRAVSDGFEELHDKLKKEVKRR